MLSYFTLLGLHFAICLSPSTVSFSGLECVIFVFFLGRILMEVDQFISAKKAGVKAFTIRRGNNDGLNHKEENEIADDGNILLKKFISYFSDRWNVLDFIVLVFYLITFILRMITWRYSTDVSDNRLLTVSEYLYGFIAMFLALRTFGQVIECVLGMGQIQIALFFIMWDVTTIFWQALAMILAFSMAITKIYVAEKAYTSGKDSAEDLACGDSGIICWWNMATLLSWSLLGLADLDKLNSVDNPSVFMIHLLYSFYLILTVILLVNMMIALLSNTYQQVQNNSLQEWSFKRAILVRTYSTYHPIPVPFNILSLPLKVLWKRGFDTPALDEIGWIKDLDDLVRELERNYFAKFGYEFLLTEEKKIDNLIQENEGNRKMTGQIARQVFQPLGNKEEKLAFGQGAWYDSQGIAVDGCLLTYLGPKFCHDCEESGFQDDAHSAKFKSPFTPETPRLEVRLMYNTGLSIQSRSLSTGNRKAKKSSRNTGNLIKINCSTDMAALNRNRTQSMLLCSLNPRSVRNKTADVLDYVCDCKTDLFAFTETWLKNDDDAVRAEICPNGYTFIGHNQIGRRGGGTGLMFRDSLGVKKVDGKEFESFEFSEWLITGNSSNVRLVIIYRPPYSDDHPVTVTTFCAEFASAIYCEDCVSYVLNIYVDDKVNSEALNFLDVLESLGLQQHVNDPTHIHGPTLDLIITRIADNIIMEKPHVDRFFSDHASVLCKLLSYMPRLMQKRITYKKIKSFDVSTLMNELAESSLCKNISHNSNVDILSASDLDNLAETYNKTLSHLLDSHAPLKTKTVVSRPKVLCPKQFLSKLSAFMASCVAVTTAIAMMLQGKHFVEESGSYDAEALIKEAFGYVCATLETDEVLIQETREKRFIGLGVVYEDYDHHYFPGWRAGTVGYHVDDGKIYEGESWCGRQVEGPMAHRGDLIACEVDFKGVHYGRIPVLFFLNGKEVARSSLEYTSGKKLIPSVALAAKGIAVLTKMCHRDGDPSRRVTNEDLQEKIDLLQEQLAELKKLVQISMEVKEKKEPTSL
ncbi:Transient receptor potential-gamma protein [Stylophora pistillata]|uniref:Transient receptor potential-gamma protein n=1 Tax=Stylophora pistillata TaxID=50429 RepID=A0A2B4RNK7_STYPI|nr:Transient receptor potential-gamma protein [Stylophora pistillata]